MKWHAGGRAWVRYVRKQEKGLTFTVLRTYG